MKQTVRVRIHDPHAGDRPRFFIVFENEKAVIDDSTGRPVIDPQNGLPIIKRRGCGLPGGRVKKADELRRAAVAEAEAKSYTDPFQRLEAIEGARNAIYRDETVEEAAARELMEETGFVVRFDLSNMESYQNEDGSHEVVVIDAYDPVGNFQPQGQEKDIAGGEYVEIPWIFGFLKFGDERFAFYRNQLKLVHGVEGAEALAKM